MHVILHSTPTFVEQGKHYSFKHATSIKNAQMYSIRTQVQYFALSQTRAKKHQTFYVVRVHIKKLLLPRTMFLHTTKALK
jgi:sulfate adenylyltransferase subunit 1 (EFTu-like GTPase family)